MLRCAIMNITCTARDAERLVVDGVDFLLLRAPDAPVDALLRCAAGIEKSIAAAQTQTRLLLHTRADVALSARAAGVHLTARPDELSPAQVRTVFARAGAPAPVISLSCHTLDDVARAREAGVDLILFGPVYEKRVAGTLMQPGVGPAPLAEACSAAGPVPVLALGGITTANTAECLAAGAAGVAGIRLFA